MSGFSSLVRDGTNAVSRASDCAYRRSTSGSGRNDSKATTVCRRVRSVVVALGSTPALYAVEALAFGWRNGVLAHNAASPRCRRCRHAFVASALSRACAWRDARHDRRRSCACGSRGGSDGNGRRRCDRLLRDRMVEEIATMARETGARDRPSAVLGRASWRRCGASSGIDSCRPTMTREAYDNRPLPIGNGQTISQPYIVALTTDLLDVERTASRARDRHRLGLPGRGARRARRARRTRSRSSSRSARDARRRGSRRSATRTSTCGIGDGYAGWPERAPFDRSW